VRARDWFLTTLGVGALLALAEEALSIDGTVWLVVRVVVSAMCTAAVVAWIASAHRARHRK
jgi:hypothetical protein